MENIQGDNDGKSTTKGEHVKTPVETLLPRRDYVILGYFMDEINEWTNS